jgi:hypothetical protein
MRGAPPWLGSWGADTGASSVKPFNLVVASVDPGGPAARAGLRADDLIDIRANTLVERYSLFPVIVPLNGRPVTLWVHRGSQQEKLTVVPRAQKLTWNFWLATFTAFWLLLFATLIAWRRADIPQMRLLSLWIVALVLNGALSFGFAAPWAWVYVLADVSKIVVTALTLALLAAFASGFAQPLSRPRRIAQWLCYTFCAIATIIALIGTAGVITLRFDPFPVVALIAMLVTIVGAVLTAVRCGILAIAASRGVERQRAVWTLVPLAAYFCSYSVVFTMSEPSYVVTIAVSLIGTLVLLSAPVALTAALSRRPIDVGFFLNRAAIFTIVSAIVIGTFVLAELAATAWLASTTHTAAFVGMAVALGLGLSLRYIHGYVDRFVDRVFFRKRHEDEWALRRFAHEASYISDRSTLLDRAVQTVKEHTSADDATVLVRDGAAAYAFATDGERAEVSENDPGIIALRAWSKPIDLHEFHDSQLRGEFAFPMVSRGELVGALICGPKRDGEAYAPDESDALQAVAHGVGTALDTLSSRDNGVMESIREMLALMLQELQKLPRAIVSALPEKNAKDS